MRVAGFTDVVFFKIGTTKTYSLIYGRPCSIFFFLSIRSAEKISAAM